MIRTFWTQLSVLAFLTARCAAIAQEPPSPSLPPDIQASSAILVDAASGQVLFERNADELRPPASTTKIMTAILLLEHLQPDDIITASKNAAEVEGSSLNLKPGEKISARDMLYALMLRSANDGCVAVAERIAGSEAKFAEMMTAKAREIGATSTLFQNANGLNDPPNVTTARDLALIARYASRYPAFNEASRTKSWTIERSTGSKDIVLKNHARFLWHFPGADGIKTGWTVPAGRCFVGGATWNGWRLISVVLNSPDWKAETAALMKYGFRGFRRVRFAARGDRIARFPVDHGGGSVEACAAEDLYWIVPRGADLALRTRADASPALAAPVAAGDRVGTVTLMDGDQPLREADLVAGAAVARVEPESGSGGWRLFGGALALLGALRYGSAAAKAARRRRGRLAQIVRSVDRGGQGHG